MATVDGKIDVNVIFISEDKLREIIRQEIARTIEPGAYRPPYLPAVPITPDWRGPLYSATTLANPDEESVTING